MSGEEQGGKVLAAVKGTHDILPGEVEVWQAVEKATSRWLEGYGYKELRAPIIEPTELFHKGTGETTDIVTKEMYSFTDKGGRSITLRPEYTPSVARAIAEHRLDLAGAPMRYYYIGPMFRYDKPQKGRYRQFHQVDVEVFGEKDPALDAEIVEMADGLLRSLGLAETEILVNSVGCRACRPAFSAALRERAAAAADRLCGDCRRKMESNPLRIFDCKVPGCREQAALFPKITGFLCAECRDHFAAFRGHLDRYGVAYRHDENLVRGLDYYTGPIYETLVEKPRIGSITGGGRFDGLVGMFAAQSLPATGTTIGLERIIDVMEELHMFPANLGQTQVQVLGSVFSTELLSESLRMATTLRDAGLHCELYYGKEPLGGQVRYALKRGIPLMVISGPDEIAAGTVTVRDLRFKFQGQAKREEAARLLRERLAIVQG